MMVAPLRLIFITYFYSKRVFNYAVYKITYWICINIFFNFLDNDVLLIASEYFYIVCSKRHLAWVILNIKLVSSRKRFSWITLVECILNKDVSNKEKLTQGTLERSNCIVAYACYVGLNFCNIYSLVLLYLIYKVQSDIGMKTHASISYSIQNKKQSCANLAHYFHCEIRIIFRLKFSIHVFTRGLNLVYFYF